MIIEGHGKSIDWYNLGVLVYEMFTGDPPFFAETQEQIFENIKNAKLEMPKSMSAEAQDFVRKLMIRDPLERQKYIDQKGIKNHAWFKEIGK